MDFWSPFIIAIKMLLGGDPELFGIIKLSLAISFTAVGVSLTIGLPVGAILASFKFPGRGVLILIANTFLGMPPIVVGLFIYVLISQSGPLGWMEILYTPHAMALAQTVLVLPISIALSRQIFENLNDEYAPLFKSLGIGRWKKISVLVVDGRVALITIALACFGRAISEVGAVIIVGGNIKHFTRVMTTAIALETSKGELAVALALGLVLLTIALCVNIASQFLKRQFNRLGNDV